jgi:formamidopyrimidine-DNA glycosylase
VPELPDLRVLAEAFTAALAGRSLVDIAVMQPLVLRGTSEEAHRFEGQRLRLVRQRGKFLTLDFGPHRMVVNAMLTGRLGLAIPGSRTPSAMAMAITFGPRLEPPDPADVAPWTHGAAWLPDEAAAVELRYRDPRRMGKVYLLPQSVARPIAGWEGMGPDIDDPALDLADWQSRIGRHHGELHSLLKDQSFVAGIGNAYKDEILWAARLGPFRKRASLAEEESERLWRAGQETTAWAIEEVRRRVPPRFEEQARDFLRVHLRGGRPCPRCGATLSEVSPGGFVTTWCRACQA